MPRRLKGWVRPGETEEVVWLRTASVDALLDGEGVVEPYSHLFRLEFLARDVSMNIGERYRFSGQVINVEPDGSRVVVGKVPATAWPDRVAAVFKRSYERLEADDEASAAAMAQLP